VRALRPELPCCTKRKGPQVKTAASAAGAQTAPARIAGPVAPRPESDPSRPALAAEQRARSAARSWLAEAQERIDLQAEARKHTATLAPPLRRDPRKLAGSQGRERACVAPPANLQTFAVLEFPARAPVCAAAAFRAQGYAIQGSIELAVFRPLCPKGGQSGCSRPGSGKVRPALPAALQAREHALPERFEPVEYLVPAQAHALAELWTVVQTCEPAAEPEPADTLGLSFPAGKALVAAGAAEAARRAPRACRAPFCHAQAGCRLLRRSRRLPHWSYHLELPAERSVVFRRAERIAMAEGQPGEQERAQQTC